MRRLLTLVVLTLLGVLGGVGTAAAHNVLIGSDPANGASIDVAPERIRLDFDLPAQSGFSSTAVIGPEGHQWQSGQATEEGSSVVTPVHPLGPAGQYTVEYRILSADGHTVTGTISFTLANPGPGSGQPLPEPATTTTPEAPPDEAAANDSTEASDEDSGGVPIWPFLVGGGLLLVLGVVVALRVGRS